MSGARLLAASDYARLKAAVSEAVRASPQGSASAFAAATRVNERTLRFYCDHSSELFAPLDVVADLEAATHEPIIARVLADLSGCVLTPKEQDEGAAALRAIRETSRATTAIADLMDLKTQGAWDLGDARAVLRDVRKAQAALAGLEQALKARVEGGR